MAKCEVYPLQRLSLWESWRKAPERARTLTVIQLHRDNIALTKSLPIAACVALPTQACPLRHLR